MNLRDSTLPSTVEGKGLGSRARQLLTRSIFSDRRLLISSSIVAAGFLLSKILGLVQRRLFAQTFGTSSDLDAFFTATTFSDLLFSVIAGGAIASVFIPVFSGYLVRDEASRRAGWKFASAVVNDIFVAVTLLSVLGMIFATPIVDNVLAPCNLGAANCLAAQQRVLIANLLRLVLVATIIFGVSGTLTSILHAHNHFLLPTLAAVLYNVGIIVGTIFLAPRWGVYGLAYGVVAGAALHLLIQVPGLIRHGAKYFLTLGLRETGVQRVAGLFGPRVVTIGVVRVNQVLMNALALQVAAGSVSALSFAYSIWQFPESLIGTAIALAVFPRLSAQFAENKTRELRATYRNAFITIMALAIPAAVATILLARPIVNLLFRGGAFGNASTDFVSTVLQFYALAVVGESLLELTSRIFYAQQDARTPMFVALGAMILRAALMLLWVNWLGAPGLALAYAIGVSVEAGALYLIARRRLGATPIVTPIASPQQVE